MRGALSVDLRTQTDYGTLRSFMDVGGQWATATQGSGGNAAPVDDAVWVDRSFIQLAGFTVGRIRSYFDINSLAPYSYANSRISGDSGVLGIYGLAYTAQFGGGITGTVSLEDNGQAKGGRGHFDANFAVPGVWGLGTISFDNKGQQMPDVVGDLRVDRTWGYAQVSGALHDASGGYYGGSNLTINGHPPDKRGFAVTGGFTLNDILGFKGDTFGMQACYSRGAAGYCTRATGPWQMYGSGNNAGFGWVTDGVYDSLGSFGSHVELTTVRGINASVQHFWTPRWRTSLYGGYVAVNYNDTAKAIINSHLPGAPGTVVCGVPVSGAATDLGIPAGGSGNSCTPNFSWWQLGTRTMFNPYPDLDVGIDLMWTHLSTAYKGAGITLDANGARPGGIYTLADQDVVTVMFRIQRLFLF